MSFLCAVQMNASYFTLVSAGLETVAFINKMTVR